MAPPTADAENIATKEKEAKGKETKDLKAKKEKQETEATKWKESRERVKSALAQGEEYFLKQYPEFEGITLQSMPYDVAMWKIYEEDGSN
ncbi:hypothetical protein NW755_007563 [Fusarium falciforme]|uniref:Uncharacterized protein n=1 Tax=Fusarium falciforme TaxID=195108 RepID=A0A9W8R4R4_9HYPO|nr:hypothetical protein NW755_007563 [Fusarium falciforme]